MLKIGSGDSGELTFLDIISIISFLVGLENLDLNLTQEDKQDLEDALNKRTKLMLNELHSHLEIQDKRLTDILIKLEELKNGSTRDIR